MPQRAVDIVSHVSWKMIYSHQKPHTCTRWRSTITCNNGTHDGSAPITHSNFFHFPGGYFCHINVLWERRPRLLSSIFFLLSIALYIRIPRFKGFCGEIWIVKNIYHFIICCKGNLIKYLRNEINILEQILTEKKSNLSPAYIN